MTFVVASRNETASLLTNAQSRAPGIHLDWNPPDLRRSTASRSSSTMTNARLAGLIAVSTTPFGADGTQNLDMFRQNVNRAIEAGSDGVLALGATGEALALSRQERTAQLTALLEEAGDRVFTVAGCMAYTPARSLEMIAEAAELGIDAAMITPSFYGGLDPEVAVANLAEIIKGSVLPVM